MAYVYTDWLQFTGAVQTGLREITRWQAREYWFPEVRSLPGAAVILSFALYPYVYLVARTAFHDLAQRDRGRPACRLRRARRVLPRRRCRSPGRRSAAARSRSWRRLPTSARCRTSASKCSRPGSSRPGSRWATALPPRSSSCLLGFVVVLLALEPLNRGRAVTIVSRPGARVRIRCAAAGRCSPSRMRRACVFGFALPAWLLGALALERSARALPR